MQMVFTPIIHTITESEIAGIRTLGFSFEGTAIPPAQFINAHFPNFDLLTLLQVVDRHLAPTAAGNIEKKIILEETDLPKLEIQYYSENCNDKIRGMALMRAFLWKDTGLIVKHQYFRLPKLFRQQGISRVILITFLQQYVNMGVKKILLYASLEDGGLVWAKLYFLAVDKEEVDAILAVAKEILQPKQFGFVDRIYTNYYSQHPEGQSFPMYKWAELPFMEPILQQSTWNGAVDLTNPQEFANFINHAIG